MTVNPGGGVVIGCVTVAILAAFGHLGLEALLAVATLPAICFLWWGWRAVANKRIRSRLPFP